METKAYLGWVDFYMELADKLLPYKNDRKTSKTVIRKISILFYRSIPERKERSSEKLPCGYSEISVLP